MEGGRGELAGGEVTPCASVRVVVNPAAFL